MGAGLKFIVANKLKLEACSCSIGSGKLKFIVFISRSLNSMVFRWERERNSEIDALCFQWKLSLSIFKWKRNWEPHKLQIGTEIRISQSSVRSEHLNRQALDGSGQLTENEQVFRERKNKFAMFR